MVKKRQYHKSAHPNLVILIKKVDKLSERIDVQQNALTAVTKSYEQHMERLANIAKHDMGNAVQNMFAALSLWRGKVDERLIDELELSLNNLNSTLSNFGQLVPNNVKEGFELPQLMNALQVLTRSDTEMNQINVTVDYDRSDTTKIYQYFQPILQMLHNFVINAKKSFTQDAPNKLIKIDSVIQDGFCVISIKNNGSPIEDDVVDKIFDFGFTTTNGSGIGLAHARFLCDEIGATINLERFVEQFTTVFTLKIPLRYDPEKNFSD